MGPAPIYARYRSFYLRFTIYDLLRAYLTATVLGVLNSRVAE
jgi:hypothetical protein